MYKLVRIAVLVLIDIIIVNLAMYVALLLRFDGIIPVQFLRSYLDFATVFTLMRIISFYVFGLYNRVWQYASVGELLAVVYSVSLGSLLNIGLVYFVMKGGQLPLPRSVFLISWLLNIFFIGGSRLVWRLIRENALGHNNGQGTRPVLIVGAGDTGVMVAKELKRHYYSEINIVGFIDDDPNKQDLRVLGLPVLGNRQAIPELVEKYGVEEIILAIPSADGKVIRKIVAYCHKTKAKTKILPGVYDLIEENVTVNHIREVQVEDLLGRDPVNVDIESMSGYLNGQVVLVTGAGGSIGSELCRQIIRFSPSKLLLLDVCENNMYDIEMEITNLNANIDVMPLVKDVRDRAAMDRIFKEHRPKVVFHAAAHKHVPLMEANSEEAIKNNVLGTYNAAQAADMWGAKKFVLISTDKAVNPTSIMGASKRLAEIIIQYMDKTSKTSFVAVRFGNVLESRGSVIPLFKKQIAAGGPVTVTHPEMARYFMTIPEAVELVIQAGALAQGGEVFVLDMGEPVRILDLARTLIKLSGFEPDKDIEIVFTGIRPGEKLFEELLTTEEGVNTTNHERIFVAKPNDLNALSIEKLFIDLDNGNLPNNGHETVGLIKKFIPDFRGKNYCSKQEVLL